MKNATLKKHLAKALQRKGREIAHISTDVAANLLPSLLVDATQTARQKALAGELRSIDNQVRNIRRRIKRAASILAGLTPMKGNTRSSNGLFGR